MTCMLLVCMLFAAPSASAQADDVAAFLEEQGLHQLLAAHLEQELMTATSDQKPALVRKLATLYAKLLEDQKDTAAHAGLQARAQLLLEQARTDEAMDLRLVLARAAYRQVEQIAEQHRLRAASSADVERAREIASQLVTQLDVLHKKLKAQLEDTMRKLGRAAGNNAVELADQSEVESRLADQSGYMLAWTLYYKAWLTNEPRSAEIAEPIFAKLLGTESPKPAPEEVSVDLRANESIARAILGMALCRSLTRSSTTALQWIELLEHPSTAEVVRKEAPAWRLVIMLEHGDFEGVARLVDSLENGLDQAPVPWLRLIAAWSLEKGKTNAEAIRLAQQAMTSLAARGSLEHLIDLAERYGTEALGSTGFAQLYVQAVLGFQNVRIDHPGDKPAGDRNIQQRFAQVGELFDRAVAQPDASQYASAAANANLLSAWCKYFRSDFLDASGAFERAAQIPALADQSEALWMAIVCLDYVVSANESNTSLARRLSTLVDRYLEQYPAGKHVPELLLRKSFHDAADDLAMIDALLNVPPSSSAYLSSRQRAASLLYKAFRAAHGDDRIRLAHRFLDVQQPLLGDELDQMLVKRNAEQVDRLVIRARQVLDVATAADVHDLGAAVEALEVIDQLLAAGVTLPDIQDEIAARRIQVELMSGNMQSACALADKLWTSDSSSAWSQLATRAVFRALLLDRQSAELAEADQATLELITRYGGRVIQEFAGKPEAFNRPETITYHVIVAEASLELWRRTQNDERAGAALFLFERLLELRPDDARFLYVTAELAGALGRNERALECWRTLLAGLDPGSEAWYEAKYNQIAILARDDKRRALGVLQQHVHLEGQYGPPPWGEKLRILEEQLTREVGSSGGDRR